MNHPKSFGVWGNTDKESFWEILPDILSWAGTKGLDAYLTTRILNHEKGSTLTSKKIRSKDDMSVLDFMLVLGGDGTFLSLARAIEHRDTPILGIHLGDLGFLAKVTLKDLFVRLDQVANGEFIIEKLPDIDIGRISAQVAKQVLVQNIKEAESVKNYELYKDKVGDTISGLVKRMEFGNIIIDLGNAEGCLLYTSPSPRD